MKLSSYGELLTKDDINNSFIYIQLIFKLGPTTFK